MSLADVAHRGDVRAMVAREAVVRSVHVHQREDAEERSGHPGSRRRRRRRSVSAQDERNAGRQGRALSRRRFAEEVPHRCEVAAAPPPQRGRSHDATLADGLATQLGNDVLRRRARLSGAFVLYAKTVEREAGARRSCAATSPANGATGAPTRGARATRRSTRSTRRTSIRCRSRGSGTRRRTATTSTIARRRSTRTAGCSPSRRRGARRSRSIRPPARRSGSGGSTKAFAGRRRRASSPAAVSRTGPTAPTSASIVVTPGYHLAILDAKTGKGDPKFGKDGVVDLMEGLGFPLVPLAVDDYESARDQRSVSGAQGEAGREVGCRRRRPAPTARSASIRRTDRSPTARRAIVVGDVIVVGNSAIHGYYPLHKHNIPGTCAASTSTPASSSGSSISFRSPASSARTRGRTDRRSARDGVGKNDPWATYIGRSRARPRLHPRRHAADRRIRRPPSGRQSVRQQRSSRST